MRPRPIIASCISGQVVRVFASGWRARQGKLPGPVVRVEACLIHVSCERDVLPSAALRSTLLDATFTPRGLTCRLAQTITFRDADSCSSPRAAPSRGRRHRPDSAGEAVQRRAREQAKGLAHPPAGDAGAGAHRGRRRRARRVRLRAGRARRSFRRRTGATSRPAPTTTRRFAPTARDTRSWDLRARRLVDVSKIDASVDILGVKWPTPIVINPVGSQRAFHPEGELAVARAAKAKNHLQVLSTVATTSIEDCIAARGAPVWFQLYHQEDWNQTKQMVKRAEHAGAPAVVFTVDLIGGSNRETMVRSRATDTRTCTNCHLGGAPMPGATGRVNELRDNRRKPAIADLKPDTPSPEVGTPTWDLGEAPSGLDVDEGVHQGHRHARGRRDRGAQRASTGCSSRTTAAARRTARARRCCRLPEVVAGVRGRVPVILDGGIRRGTDIFKGLALGATATGIGRPYIWGLASFGQEGVETVLAILRKEFEMTMRQMGTVSVRKISREHLVVHGT